MKKIHILCEGQTEESFVNNILQPYFVNLDIDVTPSILKTGRGDVRFYRGGVSSYTAIKSELLRISSNPNVFVTTMFDYYAMPNDTPWIKHQDVDLYKKIETIENAITADIGRTNVFFNFMVHEIEGLWFSDVSGFYAITEREMYIRQLQEIRASAETPEHINNSPNTAPSKRIISVLGSFQKPRQGMLVAKRIGIDKMISECKHFADWIEKIKVFSRVSGS